MTAATYTRVEVAEKLGVSESRVRQLLAIVSERIEGATVENRITEAGFNAIATYRELGRSAWLAANPIAQPQPITPVAPEPQPITQPATVVDVATAPAATVPTFTVIDGGLSAPIPAIPTAAPIVPMGQVGSQILQTTASAQMATQAVGQMVGALKQRLAIGLDTLYAQDVQSTQAIESLETELIELQTMAAEYDRAARVTAVKETMRADRVGKLTAQMGQTAARLGFQLQAQSL